MLDNKRNERGQALVLTIMILSVVMIIAFAYTGVVAKNIQMSGTNAKQLYLENIAKQGVKFVLKKLTTKPELANWRPEPKTITPDDPDYDLLEEKNYSGRENFENSRILYRIKIIEKKEGTEYIHHNDNLKGKIGIECVAREGIADGDDPTIRGKYKGLEAIYIGIVDVPEYNYQRIITNNEKIENNLNINSLLPEKKSKIISAANLENLQKINKVDNLPLNKVFENNTLQKNIIARAKDNNFIESGTVENSLKLLPEYWWRKDAGWNGPFFLPDLPIIKFDSKNYTVTYKDKENPLKSLDENNIIYVEGDIRVCGHIETPTAIFCDGTVYIDGPINSTTNSLLLYAKNHVVINTTAFEAPNYATTNSSKDYILIEEKIDLNLNNITVNAVSGEPQDYIQLVLNISPYIENDPTTQTSTSVEEESNQRVLHQKQHLKTDNRKRLSFQYPETFTHNKISEDTVVLYLPPAKNQQLTITNHDFSKGRKYILTGAKAYNADIDIHASLIAENGSIYIIPPQTNTTKITPPLRLTESRININGFLIENIPAPTPYQLQWMEKCKNIYEISFNREPSNIVSTSNNLYSIPSLPTSTEFYYLGKPL